MFKKILFPLLVIATPLSAQQELHIPSVVEDNLACLPNEWDSFQEAFGATVAWQEAMNMTRLLGQAMIPHLDPSVKDQAIDHYNATVFGGLLHGAEANAVYLIESNQEQYLNRLIDHMNTIFSQFGFEFTEEHAREAHRICLSETIKERQTG